VYVSMCVRKYACVHMCMYPCVYVCECVCVLCVYLDALFVPAVCRCACVHVGISARVFVGDSVCCGSTCMCVYVHICVGVDTSASICDAMRNSVRTRFFALQYIAVCCSILCPVLQCVAGSVYQRFFCILSQV